MFFLSIKRPQFYSVQMNVNNLGSYIYIVNMFFLLSQFWCHREIGLPYLWRVTMTFKISAFCFITVLKLWLIAIEYF